MDYCLSAAQGWQALCNTTNKTRPRHTPVPENRRGAEPVLRRRARTFSRFCRPLMSKAGGMPVRPAGRSNSLPSAGGHTQDGESGAGHRHQHEAGPRTRRRSRAGAVRQPASRATCRIRPPPVQRRQIAAMLQHNSRCRAQTVQCRAPKAPDAAPGTESSNAEHVQPHLGATRTQPGTEKQGGRDRARTLVSHGCACVVCAFGGSRIRL